MKLISASRRVDLVGGYADLFAELLDKKAPPESVHTLVIWTKSALTSLDEVWGGGGR